MPHDYMSDWDDVVAEAKLSREKAGDAWKAFGGLYKATMSDGALDKKTKELIALGMAIANQCEGCIISHVRSCLKEGATKEEIADVAGVAIMMGGGPGSVYGGKAIEVAEQFAEKLAEKG